MREDLEKFVAGYHGRDSQREKAERMFREEMKGLKKYHPRGSFSAATNDRMRPYNKGGEVGLNVESVGQAENMRHGGRSHRGRRLHRKNHYDFGGIVRDIAGAAGKILPSMIQGGVQILPHLLPLMMLKKGGHVNKARGGNIYEHEMVGEHPSHKPHHFNYESDMKGEECIGHPKTYRVSRRGKDDESHGTTFKRGGKSHYAAGGVGKIRHGVATRDGMPIRKRRIRRDMGGDVMMYDE